MFHELYLGLYYLSSNAKVRSFNNFQLKTRKNSDLPFKIDFIEDLSNQADAVGGGVRNIACFSIC